MKSNPNNKLYHILCGLRSGIPECCIAWWVHDWDKMDKSQKNLWPVPSSYSYVPCPECLITHRIVEIRQCHGRNCYVSPKCMGGRRPKDAATFEFRDKDEKDKVERILHCKEQEREAYKSIARLYHATRRRTGSWRE